MEEELKRKLFCLSQNSKELAEDIATLKERSSDITSNYIGIKGALSSINGILKTMESNVYSINSDIEKRVPIVEEGSDLGLIEMLLDITKEDLTEEEAINSLRIELNKRSLTN